MFGKAQLLHNLSVPIFYIVLMLVPSSKSAWGHTALINAQSVSKSKKEKEMN